MILAGQSGNPGFSIKNNVYDGSTGIIISGTLLRKYDYVSKSELKLASNTSAGYKLTGSGLFFSTLYESCHGINYPRAGPFGVTGDYNFYMAPYGAGYYHPPVGEFPTIAEQQFGFFLTLKKLPKELNLPDYLKIFGLRIAGKINNFLHCKNYVLQHFHEGITDCPILSQPAFKYSEVQADLSAGSYVGSIGGNFYNHNPVPSSYDRGVFVSRAAYECDVKLIKGPEPYEACVYKKDANLLPIPTYLRGRDKPSSNHSVCSNLSDLDRIPTLAGGAMDAHSEASVPNFNDSITPGQLGKDTSNHDQSIYWNFVFKYNHDALPFANTHEAGTMTQDNDQVREDHWWEHRECPENIDYLNHAFGNNINACPMNYLDVPYYAAVGKFGYFGTRFQDTWRKKNPQESGKWTDYPNVQGTNQVESDAQYSPLYSYGGSDYKPLIRQAAIEKAYHDFCFSDRVLFLNLNFNLCIASAQYAFLSTKVGGFDGLFRGLCSGVNGSGFLSSSVEEFKILAINRGGSFGFSDDPIELFTSRFIATGKYDENTLINFKSLIKDYGSFKLRSLGALDHPWYDKITNEKRRRISKAYYSSIFYGKPTDLFPSNKIDFAFEKTSDYANSDYVKYGAVPGATKNYDNKGLAITNNTPLKNLPEVDRQYFSAGFTTAFEVSGYRENILYDSVGKSINGSLLRDITYTNNNFTSAVNNFYLGYVNPRGCGNENFVAGTNAYLDLINLPNVGIFLNKAPETSPAPSVNSGSPFRKSWPDEGFNGIGKTNKNYSCFSPIFLQQPLNESVKLCQPAKFRVYAVDYHSIPEEKIKENGRSTKAYPEVDYWLRKIKTINEKGDNLYPLHYQWFRIAKASTDNYLQTKNQNLLEKPSPSGSWCCAEDGNGNDSDCTVIRPKECIDINNVTVTSWPGLQKIPGSEMGSTRDPEESFTRYMGVKDTDKGYNYFCRVSGRFGWRDSEFASLNIETTTRVQIAHINACGGGSFSFSVGGLSVGGAAAGPGLITDASVLFEQVEDETWTDRNNCHTHKFVGDEGLRGITSVWTPRTFLDARGKTVRGAHWRSFGELMSVNISLNESLATKIYADRALPYCNVTRGQTQQTILLKNGVQFLADGYTHRTSIEPGVLTDNTSVGVRAGKLRNIAELYPPNLILGDRWAKNPGHGQFQNNLGLIKRYSRIRANNADPAVVVVGQPDTQDARNYLYQQFEKAVGLDRSNAVLTGKECGYVKASLGRLMHFYVETFKTYYLLCEVGGVKPKRVKNISHIAGGLRTGHAGIQFNFLGKPNDARLKRVSMPGPYAFQWKVERHNRDRNGNGMPLSFWSYHWEEKIQNLYDAAAVYGALKKTKPTPPDPSFIKARIQAANAGAQQSNPLLFNQIFNMPWINGLPNWQIPGQASASSTIAHVQQAFKNYSIGPDDGAKLGCGGIRWRASGEMGGDKPNPYFVEWIQKAIGLGAYSSSAYGCESTNQDDCFYPCISLKYPEGFSPKGGKNLGFGMGSERHYVTSSINPSLPNPENVSVLGSTLTHKLFKVDLSPCSTNKKDICNYLTPTMHIGLDTFPIGNINASRRMLQTIILT